MPNIFPGITVTTSDSSDVSILNTSIICAMVGQFEKGPDDKPILVDQKSFKQYFGSDIEKAPDKLKYISAMEILDEAQGLYCLNVLKSALYGGLSVKASSVVDFTTGLSTIGEEHKTYDFTPAITDEISDVGDGSTITHDFTIGTLEIVPASVTIKFTVGGTQISVTDDGEGNFTDDALTLGTIEYDTEEVHLVFAVAPDASTNILSTYQYYSDELFVLVAKSKGDWSDNIGIQITELDTDYNSFKIEVYEKDVNSVETLVETLEVSRIAGQKNGFGKPIYIEDIFNNESTRFYAINNTSISTSTMPSVGTVITYADGGYDGITPTSTEYATAVGLFNTDDIDFDLFVGSGITEKTVISEISTLVNAKYKVAYIDTISGTAPAIVTYMNTTLNLDKMRLCIYAPYQYTSYNGSEYYCPLSAIAAKKKAVVSKNGQPFMPPVGVGETRGSIDTRQERYYTAAEALTMHKVGVNVARKLPGYGNVLFTDFTMQKKTSATSYQSAIFTLNNMITECEKMLYVINFKVINDSTFLQMETLINGYLSQLSRYEGTIEPDSYYIDFTDNNDVTKDAGKIYCKVVFVFQNLAREIILNLQYTSNQLFSEISGI
jgi:hypothetical protein